MIRIALGAVCLGAAVGIGYFAYLDEFKHYTGRAVELAPQAWDGVRANPVPVGIAVGTFFLTVVYHKAKGKSLRESVEAAATRVTVVTVPQSVDADGENPVVRRARARATRAQLLTDQIGLQNRVRKLPDEVLKAEKEACYTEQVVADAEQRLADKRKVHADAVARLDALRKERADGEAELAAMDAELKKLADVA
jgi:hypothetical protein